MAKREDKQPLFRLDLGTNGGEFAPYSAQELSEWIAKEISFWAWVPQAPGHSYRSVLDGACSALNNAAASASAYQNNGDPGRLVDAEAYIRSALVDQRLPHSSTPLAKLVEATAGSSKEAAAAFIFPHMPNPNGYAMESRPAKVWHAYIMGLFQEFGGPPKNDVRSQRAALEQTNNDAQRLFAARRADYDSLSADLKLALAESQEQRVQHEALFATLVEEARTSHSDAVKAHLEEMDNIRRAFKEAMALRAPVDYWSKRSVHHQRRARALTGIVLLAFASLVAAIYFAAGWAISTSANSAAPEPWRLVMVGAGGVMGVWLLRIIVRLFLSDLHLATDAAERVTMVQTYLALVEGDKLTKDDDRKLVLHSLFRPGSDGMVKDEGPPHPVLDYFTKAAGR